VSCGVSESGVWSRVRIESVAHLRLNAPRREPLGHAVVGWIIVADFAGSLLQLPVSGVGCKIKLAHEPDFI
jgi:hypothetical protein